MRFISVDGVVFDDQDACKSHEDAFLKDVEMWDMDEERYFRINPAYAAGTIKGCYRLLEEEEKRKKAEEERAQRARELREIVGAEDNE